MTVSQSPSTRSDDDYCYRPIVSVAHLPDTSFPTVMIPDRKYQPLCDTGARRAMNSFGTIDRHERGALGEGAFEQLLGLENAVDTELYEYGDPGYDFDLSIGTVDVKTARPRWDQPSLMVGASKELAADYYVLIHQLSQRCYRVLGYAPAAVVAQAPVRQIRVHEAGRVRDVSQDWLWPFTGTVVEAFRSQL
jgi:hypothetical protein